MLSYLLEKLYSHIVGTPVFEDDERHPVAFVRDVIIDPETGNLLALMINKNQIISVFDIASWGEVVRIRNSDVIAPLEDVLRVFEVYKRGIKVFGNRVETENGTILGIVVDYVIDEKAMTLKKIFTAKLVLGIFRHENRIISAKNIIEIRADKIIVRDGLKTVKEEAIDNVPVKDMALT